MMRRRTKKPDLLLLQKKSVCVLAVNNSKWFWLKSLFEGKFASHPAVKLYGELGDRRKPTEIELRALKRRLRSTHRLKGHQYLGKNGCYQKNSFYQSRKNSSWEKDTGFMNSYVNLFAILK